MFNMFKNSVSKLRIVDSLSHFTVGFTTGYVGHKIGNRTANYVDCMKGNEFASTNDYKKINSCEQKKRPKPR